MKILLIVAWALLPAWSAAETVVVRGLVVDAASAAPVEGANIAVGQQGAVTDVDGRFKLQVDSADSLRVTHVGYVPAVVAVAADGKLLTVLLHADVLQERGVTVRGGLTERSIDRVAAGVTVMDRRQLNASGAAHVQDLIEAVPNLNWAGGTARPRYFQIRGIGERSQYAGEGAPNFSVGFVVDDVELSGLGAGLLFDMAQMEVFKGPQSTVFGPNALAGAVHLASVDPLPVPGRSVAVTGGSDALLRYAATVNLPLGQRLAVRAGVQAGRADGFRDNRFLGRDDTNRRRETLGRIKARYAGPGGLVLLGTYFRLDADNGYDVWAPDNNEDLETFSDQPGKDHQQTDALSLRATLPVGGGAELVSITSYARTDLEYSFDGDWGNDGFWLQEPYGFDPEVEGWSYDFFDRTLRQRDSFTQELRLRRGGAIAGAYYRRVEETDNAVGYLFGGDAGDLRGAFDVDDLAFYGQYEHTLSPRLRLAASLRADRNAIDYAGVTNAGAEDVRFDVAQWLLGGRAAATWAWREGYSAFAAVSRGYRAGGVNQHPFLAAANRPYDPEYVLNFEVGLRALGPRHTAALTVFHARRSDQQVNLSAQQRAGDPNSFFFFVANAASGRNSGIEAEGRYRLDRNWRLSGSLALLDTHVDAYTFQAADGQAQSLGGRAAAHAPGYGLRLGLEYGVGEGVFGRAEWAATDRFYFSDSHDQKSQAYQLFHGSLGYRMGAWTLTLWGRNLLDERYAVRGFFFGLEPPAYADTLYVSYGDPRQIGVRLAADF